MTLVASLNPVCSHLGLNLTKYHIVPRGDSYTEEVIGTISTEHCSLALPSEPTRAVFQGRKLQKVYIPARGIQRSWAGRGTGAAFLPKPSMFVIMEMPEVWMKQKIKDAQESTGDSVRTRSCPHCYMNIYRWTNISNKSNLRKNWFIMAQSSRLSPSPRGISGAGT